MPVHRDGYASPIVPFAHVPKVVRSLGELRKAPRGKPVTAAARNARKPARVGRTAQKSSSGSGWSNAPTIGALSSLRPRLAKATGVRSTTSSSGLAGAVKAAIAKSKLCKIEANTVRACTAGGGLGGSVEAKVAHRLILFFEHLPHHLSYHSKI